MIYFIRIALGWITMILITFGGFFVMDRKTKKWYRYVGAVGHALFIIWILFLIQHYPKNILTLLTAISMFFALLGSIIGLRKKEIQLTLKVGIRLCLYLLILLILCNYSLKRGSDIRIPIILKQRMDSIK